MDGLAGIGQERKHDRTGTADHQTMLDDVVDHQTRSTRAQIVPLITLGWWYKAVERIGASRSAIFQNLTPVVGVILAATLLREPLEPSVIIGGALVLVGVALTTSGLGRPRRR